MKRSATALLSAILLTNAALTAADPPVPWTGLLGPAAERHGDTMAVHDDTLLVAAPGSISERALPVEVYDRTTVPPWQKRTEIAPPAGAGAAFGLQTQHNGSDLAAVRNQTVTWIFQRHLGGANAWGLLATVPMTATATAIGTIAFNGDRLAAAQSTGGASRRVVIHERNHPVTNAWGVRALLDNPLAEPAVFSGVAFGNTVLLDGSTLVVTGLDPSPGVSARLLFHLHRRDQGGANAWGLASTLRPADIPGVQSFSGTPPVFTNERLVVAVTRTTAAGGGRAIKILRAPVGAGGTWSDELTILPPSPDTVPESWGIHIVRVAADAVAVSEERRLAAPAGAIERRVSVFRGVGGTVSLERDTVIGPPAEVIAAGSIPDIPPVVASGGNTLAARTRDALASWRSATAPRSVEVRERNAGGANQWGLTLRTAAPGATPGRFGNAVAVTSRWLAVGDPEDATDAANAGAVFLYERRDGAPADDRWQLRRRLRSPTPVAGARFGTAVALSDSGVLAVTSPGTDQVSIYRASASWNHVTTISRPAGFDGAAGFAGAVALTPSGADVLVGASNALDAGGTARTGAVLHYRATVPADPTAYSLLTTLHPSAGAAGDLFGWALDCTETRLAVTRFGNGGGLHAYRRTAGTGTTFGGEETLASPDPSRGLFGSSVALHDRLMVVGTSPPLFGTNAGGAFLYRHNGTSWGFLAALLPPSSQSGYGSSVALDRNVVAVGSPQGLPGLAGGAGGGVQLFYTSLAGGGLHRQRHTVPMSFGSTGDAAGAALAFSAETLVAGAPGSDSARTWRIGAYQQWLGDRNVPQDFEAPDADPDRDGRSNLIEYMTGGNPMAFDRPNTDPESGEGVLHGIHFGTFPSLALTNPPYWLFLYRAPAHFDDYVFADSLGRRLASDVRMTFERRSTTGGFGPVVPFETPIHGLADRFTGVPEADRTRLYRLRFEYPWVK